MFDSLKKVFGRTEPASGIAFSDSAMLSQWQQHAVDGRRVTTFRPLSGESIAGVVLFLHGHGGVGLEENAVFTRLLQSHNLAAVCPDGRRSWWLDVISADFDERQTPQAWLLETIVPWIGERFDIAPPRIALLGVSMGGQGVLQLAYRHASQFLVVAAISPAVDFDQLYGAGIPLDQMFESREAARQATVVLNLHPLAWPKHQWFCCDPADTEWFDGVARLGMKLSSSGILHERDLETTGGSHSWDYFNRMAPAAIAHIAKGLRSVEASSLS